MSERDDGLGRRELPISVLRHYDYRLIWAGDAVSNIGTRMHAVALSWQVYELTGSVALLGLLGLVRAVALMLTAMIGGALADTYDRRQILIWSNIVMLVLSALIAAATFTGVVNVPLLFIVAALVAAASAFDDPARAALIPALMPRQRIADAMSVNILTGNVANMAGPAVGGLMVAAIGVGGTYALDAASFVAVVGALLVMKQRPKTPPRTADSNVGAVVEGLKFIRATPIIYAVMLLDFMATLLGNEVSLAPVFAEEIFNAGPQGLGLLLSAPAVGAVCGGALISLLPAPRQPGRIIVSAVVAYGIFMVLFGLSPNLWVGMLFLAGSGAADALSMTMRHTIRNLATPDALRGRIAATHSVFSAGGPRLGEFQTGMTASLVGAREAMLIGGMGCVAAALALAWAIPALTSYRFTSSEPVSESEPAD